MATVLAPNPSFFTGKGTNTYVVGRGAGVIVIDPGSDDQEHLDRVVGEVHRLGRPGGIVLTHHHPDHREGAEDLAAMLHVALMAFPHEHAPRLDRRLADGDQVDTGAGALRVVLTPGHSTDHVCLLWEEERILFAGDLVAGEGYIVIDPPEGNMRAYLDSLARVRDLDLAEIRPGHGPVIDDPKAFIDGYIAHRLEREQKVLQALEPGRAVTLDAILPLAYDDTPEALHPIAARSLQAHLDKLVEDGLVVAMGTDSTGATLYRRV